MIDGSSFGISKVRNPYDNSMFVFFRDFKNKDVLDCIKLTYEEIMNPKAARDKIDNFVKEIKAISGGIWEV